MKTVNIKGKEYAMVNERIKDFRENNKDGDIITTMLNDDNGKCIFRAEIIVGGIVRATGHAYEKEGSTFINKTSYIENCETSAIGRALGIFGIGLDTSIASAEEVLNAQANQNKTDYVKQLKVKIKEAGAKDKSEADEILKELSGIEDLDKVTELKAKEILQGM